jgi:dienelactone hydrolase
MRRKFSVILLLALLLLITIFFSQIRLGVIGALFLWDLLDEKNVHDPDRGLLARVTPSLSIERLQIRQGERNVPADLYFLKNDRTRAAIVLTHGIIEDGKDDPRLIRFAQALARAGFVVLVPELKGMKSFRILFSDVNDIVASFTHLRSLKDRVDETRMGLLGFSYGAGPTFMAAVDPSIRDQIKFLVSFGGYYDPMNVIRFITTGAYEYGAEKGFLKPDPYGKWVFFRNNVEHVGNEKDRKLLRAIFENEEKGRKKEAVELVSGLSPEGRSLYELVVNEDPHRVDLLVKIIDANIQKYLDKLSLAPIVPSVHAYLLIGHGNTDRLIPYTESLRLANAVKDERKVHVAILKLFSHVDPARLRLSSWEFLTVYLPSMIQFYYLVYDLLSQQL